MKIRRIPFTGFAVGIGTDKHGKVAEVFRFDPRWNEPDYVYSTPRLSFRIFPGHPTWPPWFMLDKRMIYAQVGRLDIEVEW
jgi:hypothetical protein